MAYKAYIKDGSSLVPFPSGSGSTSSAQVTTSSARDSEVTTFTTPAYEVGSNTLQVFLNGLLCAKGSEYTETASGKVTFTSPVPKDVTITALVTSGAGATQCVVSAARTADMPEGSVWTVPEHEMFKGKIDVFLDGLMLLPNVDFAEISSTTISFNCVVSKNVQIIIYVRS